MEDGLSRTEHVWHCDRYSRPSHPISNAILLAGSAGAVFLSLVLIPMAVRYVIAMTGASGAIYGIRLLQELEGEKYLVVSETAKRIIPEETSYSYEEVCGMADHVLEDSDLFACIASGSFRYDAMIVVPCSESNVAKFACGIADTLISRSVSVCMKEGRRLVLVVRETPKSAIMLENELKLARLGVCILDANPGFYPKPATVDDLVDIVVGRCMDQIGAEHSLYKRWERSGLPNAIIERTSKPSPMNILSRNICLDGMPLLSLRRSWIQHEPMPRSSASSCIMMDAMEQSSIQTSEILASAVTATANVAVSRALAPLALQPASKRISAMSSTLTRHTGLMPREEGARSPASIMRFFSSSVSMAEGSNTLVVLRDLAMSMKLIPARWPAFRGRPAWPCC